MEESAVQGVPGRSLQMHHCLVTIWWVLIAACCDMVRRRVGVGGAGAAVLCSGGPHAPTDTSNAAVLCD